MDSPEQKFFVSDDGKEKLSITKAELQAGIDSGKYGEKTLAWTKGMSGWLPLSDPSWGKHGIVIEPQPPPLPPTEKKTTQTKKSSIDEGTLDQSLENKTGREFNGKLLITRRWCFQAGGQKIGILLDGVEAGFISNGSKRVIDDLTPGNHEIIFTIRTPKLLIGSRESIISQSTAVIYSKVTSEIEISNSFDGWSVESKQFSSQEKEYTGKISSHLRWLLIAIIAGLTFYITKGTVFRSGGRVTDESILYAILTAGVVAFFCHWLFFGLTKLNKQVPPPKKKTATKRKP
jgi:hypothetical protein